MVLATTLGLLMTSCNKSKDKDSEKDDPKLEIPIANQLKIYFDNSTVDLARYDSGFVILQREGTGIQYLKRFVKADNILKVDIDDLTEGKYKVSMHINVRLKNDNKQIWRQFRYEKDVQIVHAGVAIKGPVNELKKDWKIYGVMADINKTFHITLPIDCTDPHMEIYSRDPQWEYFYIERVAYKRTGEQSRTNLGAESFECYGDCFDNNGNKVDNETFKNWATLIATKTWDVGEFFVLVNNTDPEKDLLFQHFYDIPDLQ